MKNYKVEPPELVRQMWAAGLNVRANAEDGTEYSYEPPPDLDNPGSDLMTRLEYPPSWVKEIEQEQIQASRIKVDAPVEVSNYSGKWRNRYWSRYVEQDMFPYSVWVEGGTSWSTTAEIGYKHWRIPANTDPEAWKREWLIPEKEKSEDIDAFDDAAHLREQEVASKIAEALNKNETCPICNGCMILTNGDGTYADCSECNGTGEVDHG